MQTLNFSILLFAFLIPIGLTAQVDTLESIGEEATADAMFRQFAEVNKSALLDTDIKVFEVDAFKAAAGTANVLEEFEILQTATPNKEEAAFICDMLLDADRYFFTNKIKQCLFLPQAGIQFASDTDTVNVLVSFDCGMIRFYKSGKYSLYYINKEMDPLQLYLNDLLPMATPTPEAEPIANTASDAGSGFAAMAPMPATCTAQRDPGAGIPLGAMVAKQPVYYILKEGEGYQQLASLLNEECAMDVNIEKLCRLNNLSLEAFKKIGPGTTLVIGYASDWK